MATTGFHLLDHRNPHGDHFYPTRRDAVLAIVVHITAGLQDLDTTDDHSAEATAGYAATTTRKVSWHSGSDSDSSLQLLPASFTAWHCAGYNASTYGHEISKTDVYWGDEPARWVERSLWHAAERLRPVARKFNVPLRVASRVELDHARATHGAPVGFIGHAPLDPTRRRDPGPDFPWATLLGLVAQGWVTPEPPPLLPAKETDVGDYLIRRQGESGVVLVTTNDRGIPPLPVDDVTTLGQLETRLGKALDLDPAQYEAWLKRGT